MSFFREKKSPEKRTHVSNVLNRPYLHIHEEIPPLDNAFETFFPYF